MKKLILIISLTLMTSSCPLDADELQIPFSCWTQDLQEEFKNIGKKLDLSPADRTDDSWGYINSQGSKFSLFTYNPVESHEFSEIQAIVWKVEEKHGKK